MLRAEKPQISGAIYFPPIRGQTMAKRSRKTLDEVTFEENKGMDGEYWLIDSNSSRFQRRVKRNVENITAFELGATGDDSFVSREIQKEEQLNSIMEDLQERVKNRAANTRYCEIYVSSDSDDEDGYFLEEEETVAQAFANIGAPKFAPQSKRRKTSHSTEIPISGSLLDRDFEPYIQSIRAKDASISDKHSGAKLRKKPSSTEPSLSIPPIVSSTILHNIPSLVLPPNCPVEPHSFPFPRRLYSPFHSHPNPNPTPENEHISTPITTEQPETLTDQFIPFLEQTQQSFACITSLFHSMVSHITPQHEENQGICNCLSCYAFASFSFEHRKKSEIQEPQQQIKQELLNYKTKYVHIISSQCDEGCSESRSQFQKRVNNVVSCELLTLFQLPLLYQPLIKILWECSERFEDFKSLEELRILFASSSSLFSFLLWLRIFLLDFLNLVGFPDLFNNSIEFFFHDCAALFVHFPSLFHTTVSYPPLSLHALWKVIIDLLCTCELEKNLWNGFNRMVLAWTDVPSYFSLTELLTTFFQDENMGLHESQVEELLYPVTGSFSSLEKKKIQSKGDLLEVIWLLFFRAIPYYQESNWELVFRLVEAAPLLCSAKTKQHSELFKSFVHLVDENGSIRPWICSSKDTSYIREIISRVVLLSQHWNTKPLSDASTFVDRLVMQFFEHFRILQCYDSSTSFPTFLSDSRIKNNKLPPNAKDGDFSLLLTFLSNYLFDLRENGEEKAMARISSKFFGKLLNLQQQTKIIESSHFFLSPCFLTPLRNSISLLVTFSTFCKADSTLFSSLLQRMKKLLHFKQNRSLRAHHMVIEGFFMVVLSNQYRFALPVFLRDAKELERCEHSFLLLLQHLESSFLTISNCITPLVDDIVSKMNEKGEQMEGGNVAAATNYFSILSYLLKCIQLIYNRMISTHGTLISTHSLLQCVPFGFLLEKNNSLPISLISLACRLLSSAFASVVTPFEQKIKENEEESDEEIIEKMVQQEEQKKAFHHHQFYAGRLLCLFLREKGIDKSILLFFSSLFNATSKNNNNGRLLERLARCVGEMVGLMVYFGFESWNYYYGRFGSKSNWLQNSSSEMHRQVPIRIFTNAIVFTHKLKNSVVCPTSRKRKITTPLDEDEMITLWLITMIEPIYSNLQSLFTCVLQTRFPMIHGSCKWVPQLFPGGSNILPERENLFLYRKTVLYRFVDSLPLVIVGDKDTPSKDDMAQFHGWFHTIPKRLSSALLCSDTQSAAMLLQHVKFSFSLIGRLLSHCTVLLYRPMIQFSLLPTILLHFFKTSVLDISYRLLYIPNVVLAFDKLSELYYIQTDSCLQREFQEFFDFYWKRMIAPANRTQTEEQKKIVRTFSVAFVATKGKQLRHFFLRSVLLPRATQPNSCALQLFSKILCSRTDKESILDDISAVEDKLAGIMLCENSSLQNRLTFYSSFWYRIMTRIHDLEIPSQHAIEDLIHLLLLLLFDDLARVLTSSFRASPCPTPLHSILNEAFLALKESFFRIKKGRQGTVSPAVTFSFNLSRVSAPYPGYTHEVEKRMEVDKLFQSIEKTILASTSGKFFVQFSLFPIWHVFAQQFFGSHFFRSRYQTFLSSLGPFGLPYLCQDSSSFHFPIL